MGELEAYGEERGREKGVFRSPGTTSAFLTRVASHQTAHFICHHFNGLRGDQEKNIC